MRRGGWHVCAGQGDDQGHGDPHPRSSPSGEGETDPFQLLMARENEVLACLRQGKPNKIIAHELAISESTVKVFVRRILMKLGASNRAEAVVLRHGRADPARTG
jgi:DNA-binding NarL/FixJ family response regulator